MKCPSQISLFDKSRKMVADSCLDFSRVLSKLGRDVVHVQSAVDIRLISTVDRAMGAYQFILIEFQAVALRPASKRDVVLFAAGKVIERKGKLIVVDHAQIGVDDQPAAINNSTINNDAGFRFSLANDLAYAGQAHKAIHDSLGICRTGEKIDVTDNLFPATKAAAYFQTDNVAEAAETFKQRIGNCFRLIESNSIAGLADKGDTFEDLLLSLGAEAFQARHAAFLAGLLKLGEVIDPEL